MVENKNSVIEPFSSSPGERSPELNAAVEEQDGLRVYDPVCGEGKYILTPPFPACPRINGPAVFGVRPGAPFHYSIPATGDKPLTFSAEGLPDGLLLDEATGFIDGAIADLTKREYRVQLKAINEKGGAEKSFSIFVGDEICLTPPLGWNSWNCWKHAVSQEHVLDSAKAMVDKGLANFGWSYVNIDDGWQGRRCGPFNAIAPEPKQFPDLGNLCDELHALGLKVGIYSCPWITTYAGRIGGSSDQPDGYWDQTMGTREQRKTKAVYRIGPYTFDVNDTAQWASWGIDYLKYDWNPNDPESTLRMAAALKGCGRDIVYSLSNSAPVENAELYGAVVNCWRTAGDLKDRWDQDGPHLNVRDQWQLHRQWMENGVRGGPGRFPDADMLVVGDMVTSSEDTISQHPSRLTADEQYSHLSLWVLWSCPLLIGCPIETMDEFTLNLLTNAEVLDIQQDERAVPGRSVDLESDVEVVVKDLSDGGKAVGVFNKSGRDQVCSVDWKTLGLHGEILLRDPWRQQNIGIFNRRFRANVRSHGVVMFRTIP